MQALLGGELPRRSCQQREYLNTNDPITRPAAFPQSPARNCGTDMMNLAFVVGCHFLSWSRRPAFRFCYPSSQDSAANLGS